MEFATVLEDEALGRNVTPSLVLSRHGIKRKLIQEIDNAIKKRACTHVEINHVLHRQPNHANTIAFQ